MAHDDLIEPGLRRWRSYERRFPRRHEATLEHRAHDLVKGWKERLFADHSYDGACLQHLALSFAEVLTMESSSMDNASASAHGVTK